MSEHDQHEPEAQQQPERSFAEMLDDYAMNEKQLAPGDRVRATVVSVGNDHLLLDVGERSEAVMAIDASAESKEEAFAAGDKLDVYILSVMDGAISCARQLSGAGGRPGQADKNAALAQLEEARVNNMPVEGMVKEMIKGGYKVSVLGQRGFCPQSQIDRWPSDNPEEHVGHTYSFAIQQIKEHGRDIVVSRRRLLEREERERAEVIWESIKEGDVFDGVVKSLQSYGAFVDIGGLQGLLHVSEISHERIEDPSTVLTLGENIKVAVKKIDRENRKVGLSLKSLLDDPWLEAASMLHVDSEGEGRVVRLARFGAFVEVMNGVEGLVHISELGQGRRINSPADVISVDEILRYRVLEIDVERHRISLTVVNSDVSDTELSPATAAPRAAGPQRREEIPPKSGLGTLGDLFADKFKD